MSEMVEIAVEIAAEIEVEIEIVGWMTVTVPQALANPLARQTKGASLHHPACHSLATSTR
jgi:hypothetical protein